MTSLWETSKKNVFNNPAFPGKQERRIACASGSGSEAPPSHFSSHSPPLPSPGDQNSCEFGSAKYYAICGFGGILSCGLTHTAVVPLDLVKCRIQVSL
jgi:hypothetical protein